MEDSIKSEVYKYIISLIYKDKTNSEKPINILNISFDTSKISKIIRETQKNSKVFNLQVVTDIDDTVKKTLEFLYEEKYFDVIIINNVLEAIINPWEFLKNIKKYLKSEGSVIANVENIMYCKIINSIIGGTFTYLDDGEPKINELRSFSLLQSQKLFDYVGFNIETTLSVKPKEIEKYKNLIDNLCKITNEGLREQYDSYNYIIKAYIRPKKTLENYVLNN